MDEYEDMKYYIDDRIADGLNKIYDKLESEILIMVDEKIEVATGELLSADEAADLLDVTNRTLYNWARSGVLPRYRLGGKLYWKYDDIMNHLESDEG